MTSLKSLAKKEGMKAAIAKHILALEQSDPKEYKSARVSLKKESQLLDFFIEGGIDLKNKESSVFQLFSPMLASSPSTSAPCMFGRLNEMRPLTDFTTPRAMGPKGRGESSAEDADGLSSKSEHKQSIGGVESSESLCHANS